MAAIKNNGVSIYYEVHGTGKPLVLLRGLSGTVDGWEPYLEYFIDKYQLILIENRGAGKSDKPDEPYTIEIFASDVKAVLDAEGIKKTALLGLSMGGFISQAFYENYPDHVSALILGCTGTGFNDPNHVRFSLNVERILWAERTPENRKEIHKEFFDHFFHKDFRKNNPKFMERMLEVSLVDPQPHYAYLRQLKACYFAGPLSENLNTVNVPTLIMHGIDDEITPVQNAYFLAENIPNADVNLHIFHHAGHMFFIEQKEKFIKILRTFLDDL